MSKIIGKKTVEFQNTPYILSWGAVGSKFEKEGPLGKYFDEIFENPIAEMKTWEQAESKFQKTALKTAIKKTNLKTLDYIFAGDLLNQCVGSTFGIMDYKIPFVGLYGACSTMALALINASVFLESGIGNNVGAITSSHFCAAEKQYRFPLEYGNQRPQNAQWTATASGAVVLTNTPQKIEIFRAMVGTVQDFGIKDTNNMGAAMAPDDVKIRPYPTNEGMVFFYTQIQYLRGLRALF